MILVVGSVALDTIKTPFGSVENILGGSAVHFSVAASIIGKVCIVGVVGEDFSDVYIQYLSKKGIDVEGLKKVPGKTFRWEGYYEYDMNQAHTVKTELNVFKDFHPEIPERTGSPDGRTGKGNLLRGDPDPAGGRNRRHTGQAWWPNCEGPRSGQGVTASGPDRLPGYPLSWAASGKDRLPQ